MIELLMFMLQTKRIFSRRLPPSFLPLATGQLGPQVCNHLPYVDPCQIQLLLGTEDATNYVQPKDTLCSSIIFSNNNGHLL